MWTNTPPDLPGYIFCGCNRLGSRPSHEIGALRLSSNVAAIWIVHNSDMTSRSQLIDHLPLALREKSPAVAIAELNDELCQQVPDRQKQPGQFSEICIMVFDRLDHSLTVTTAGFHGPILRRPDNCFTPLDAGDGGLPLGVVPGQTFETITVHLEPETAIIWISPYTTQVLRPDGGVYGAHGPYRQVLAGPHEPEPLMDYLVRDIDEFRGGRDQTEDICIICARRDDS